MRRFLSLILMLAMILPVMAACGIEPSSSAVSGETTAAQTTTAENEQQDDNEPDKSHFSEELAALDYDGTTISVISRSDLPIARGDRDWKAMDVLVEELTGEVINDALYNRNAAVEKILNVNIEQTVVEDNHKLYDAVEEMINSGEDTYDIISGTISVDSSLIYDGFVHNLYSNGINTYLNADNPWWAQHWIESAELDGKLYTITGAAALSLYRNAYAIFYNKTFGEELGREDLYEVVERGDWTIDYCTEVIAGIRRDITGDGGCGEGDEFGMYINDYCDMFWSAFDMNMLKKSDDGWFEVAVEDKDKIFTAFDKIFSLVHKNPSAYKVSDGWGFRISSDVFALGNTYITAIPLKHTESIHFRGMYDEYGIIPLPKFDKEQEDYYTYSGDQYTMFMIPRTARNPEMSGAVLEAMACESYNSVLPTYFDFALRGRYVEGSQEKRVLDKIIENIDVDSSWIYGEVLGESAASVLRRLVFNIDENVEEAYAKQEKVLPKIILAFRNQMESLGD